MQLSAIRLVIVALLSAAALWASGRPAAAQSCDITIDNLSFGTVQTSNGLAVDVNTTLRATCTINPLHLARTGLHLSLYQ